jgi:hypothetical protein
MPKAPIGYTPGQNPTVAPGYVQGQAQIAGAEASAREAAQRSTIAYQTQQAIAEAAAKAKIAQEAEAKKASALDPQKVANLRAAQAQINRLNTLFAKGPGSTKGFSSLLDFLPSAKNAQFDTAGAGLGEVGLAAFRVPGVGSQSDAELRAFIAANRPSASDFDARIKEKLLNLQSRLNQTYSAYGIKRQQKAKSAPKVIDFSDLPE